VRSGVREGVAMTYAGAGGLKMSDKNKRGRSARVAELIQT